MSFNTNKCYTFNIKNKIDFFYSLNNATMVMERVNSNTYIGLTISEDLKWHSHISTVTKKQTPHSVFLDVTRHCPINSKRTAYIALVHSLLEYGSIVWDPYLSPGRHKPTRANSTPRRQFHPWRLCRLRHEGCVH